MLAIDTYISEIRLPPRSDLYSMDYIKLGDSNVEAFTSYITRLANKHALDPHSLIAYKILPLLSKGYLYTEGKHVHDNLSTTWWRGISITLNSLNSLTQEWIQALESLTLRTDLSFTTMLTYNDVIPYRGLIRNIKAWCPECYEEWKQAEHTIYDPLLWMLEVVTICPKHYRKLQFACPFPDCGKTIFALSPRGQPGFCSFCNKWLGANKPTNRIPTATELEHQIYVLQAVGEMLAAAPTLTVTPRKENIAAAIRRYIDEELDGNATALARLIGVHYTTVYDLRDGKQLPQLATLLRLTALFGITPFYLLTADTPTYMRAKEIRLNTPTTSKKPRQPSRFNKTRMRELLEAKLLSSPPLSMKEIADELGYDQTFLTERLPDLCKQISARFAEYQEAQKKARIENDCKEARERAISLHSEGTYPARSLIGGILRDATVRMAYLEVMKKLGYRK